MAAKVGSHRYLKRGAMPGFALLFTVFCCVSGGPFGLEPIVSESGVGVGLLLIAVMPFLWALPDALTTCELAPAMPVEGGYIMWVRRAMGPFAGFLNAWWTWIYTLVDASIYPVLFATYLAATSKLLLGTDALNGELAQWSLAAAMIAFFSWLNFRGTRLVGFTSIGLALAIMIPFAVLVLVGVIKLIGSPRELPLSFPADGESLRASLASGLGIVMWNYLGWDALSTIAEEVEQPQKAYPRALLTGIVMVTLVYFLPTLIGLYFFPEASKWVEGAWPAIGEAVGGPVLAHLIGIAAIASPIALFTASLLASSRVPFVLAEQRFLPKPFVALHPKYGTPWVAILFSAIVFSIFATKRFHELVSLNVIMYSAALVLETSALLVLRVKEPDLPRPFKIPGGWPVLGLIWILPVSIAGLMLTLSIIEDGLLAQWIELSCLASGPVIYFVIRAFRSPKRQT